VAATITIDIAPDAFLLDSLIVVFIPCGEDSKTAMYYVVDIAEEKGGLRAMIHRALVVQPHECDDKAPSSLARLPLVPTAMRKARQSGWHGWQGSRSIG
jgi:hypothetical protein